MYDSENQRLQSEEDPVNHPFANAHISVVTKQWTAEQECAYYQTIADPIDVETSEIPEFGNAATED